MRRNYVGRVCALTWAGASIESEALMDEYQTTVVQYLGEARASELGLVRVLQSQIAMTPRGAYRTALEEHLTQTRDHATRVDARLEELDRVRGPRARLVAIAQSVVGQALALGKTPLDLLRGSGGPEKVLKNAKDACATEALEIATYRALERLADATGDKQTAALAAAIRADEEQMLERVLREIPKLTDAVIRADNGSQSFDIKATGVGEAVRRTGREVAKAVPVTRATAGRTARTMPGVARTEARLVGVAAAVDDLPIARYDKLTAEEISGRLPTLSQTDLGKIDAYERAHDSRATILSHTSSLRANEPWPGYDELTVAEIRAVLSEGDEQRARHVAAYERSHKNRATLLKTTARQAVKR
jgi:ferritin-like metal-binding protein YciE